MTEFPTFNHTLLAPVTGLFNDVLDRSLSAFKDADCSSQFLGVSFGILSFTDSTCCR